MLRTSPEGQKLSLTDSIWPTIVDKALYKELYMNQT